MTDELVRDSKFLSLVLRHRPETIGLSLDAQGWADVDELLAAARRSGRALTRERLLRAVRENDKQRFALSDDGARIRANQGHSVHVELGLTPRQPPDLLYHGTVGRFLDSIRKQGLLPGGRQHVHLSHDVETAAKVGRRRGKPVVLEIRAGDMHAGGMEFYVSQNGVWLTGQVPPRFISFPQSATGPNRPIPESR